MATIRLKKPTIPQRHEMNLSWVATKPAKLDFFKGPEPFYNVWHDTRNVEILAPWYTYKIPVNMQIFQMRLVGLGVLENDGNGWVSKHGG